MKTFVILCLAGVAFSLPNYEKDVKLSEGRIIGGEEAPKRKNFFLKMIYEACLFNDKLLNV